MKLHSAEWRPQTDEGKYLLFMLQLSWKAHGRCRLCLCRNSCVPGYAKRTSDYLTCQYNFESGFQPDYDTLLEEYDENKLCSSEI